MKIVYFNFAAVGVITIMLFSALYRKIGKGYGNKAFLIVISEAFLTTVMDICAVYMDNAGAGNVFGKYFFHSGYLFLHTVSSLFYLFYLISLTDTWHKFLRRKYLFACILAPGLFYLVLVILNLFGAVDLFHLDGTDTYTRGVWFAAGYIIGASYMLIGLIYIIAYRKLFSTRWILTLFTPYPFVIVAMLLQFIRPYLVIEMFFNALGFLFIYANIQKPEELIDPVTHLSNENAFEDYSRRVFYNQKNTSVVLIDIQNYDVIHDTLNLDSLRSFLSQCAQTIDFVTRKNGIKADIFAGEHGHFYVFAEQRFKDKIPVYANDLSSQFTDNSYFRNSEIQPHSVINILSIPDDISDFADFIRFTNCDFDKLKSGRVYFAEDLFKDNYYNILININSIIADALRYNRFEVYYQPIYSCRLDRFVSAEALLRLKDPEYGFISPDLFIPAAERSGMIAQISNYVLKTVCEFIASDDFEHLGIEYIEVNLSALECVQDNLKERVMSCIHMADIPCSKLALEITETALIYDSEKVKENLCALSDRGIRFCLDDYGTGYSDTRRIVDLPLSIVKLDKSFLFGFERKLNQIIVQDTVKMITDVGNHVIAEGVETKEVLQLLEKYGCDLIQGYYFSKPLPRDAFVELCRSRAGSRSSAEPAD